MQKSPPRFIKRAAVLILFLSLCVSLFLGDGSQAAVEVFFAITLVLLYGLLFVGKIDIIAPSKAVTTAWIGLIVYACLRGAVSDSVALSLSWVVRLAEGYLTFLLFRSISRDAWGSDSAVKFFVFVGVFAGLVSLVLLIFPGFSRFLPQINLLYATYGHNYVAALLLFVLPIFAFHVLSRPTTQRIAAYFTWCAVIVLTFSRGAWLLSLGFLLLLIWHHRFAGRRSLPFVISGLIFVLAGLTVFSISVGFFRAPGLSITERLHEQVIKSPPWEDGRLGYWKSAIAGFTRSPFVGSGPGTFALISKDAPSGTDKSIWAHSFPLQILAEMGFVGAALLFVLMWLVFRENLLVVLRRRPRAMLGEDAIAWGLFCGSALLLLYSFYEAVFDFLTMWLLFWAVLGTINAVNAQAASHHPRRAPLVVALLVLLALFYVTYWAHTALKFYEPHSAITLITALPNERNTRDHLDSAPRDCASPPWQTPAIMFMYKRDPDVLAALARAVEDCNPLLANRLLLESMQLDPTSIDDERQYFLFVAAHPRFVNRQNASSLVDLLLHITMEQPRLTPSYQSGPFENAFIDIMHGSKPIAVDWHFFSKLYYLLALRLIKTQPDAVPPLLSEAALLEPAWSYYHLELASYTLYALRNQSLANKILSSCEQFQFAKEDCMFYMSQPLPIVGYYKKNIMDIR